MNCHVIFIFSLQIAHHTVMFIVNLHVQWLSHIFYWAVKFYSTRYILCGGFIISSLLSMVHMLFSTILTCSLKLFLVGCVLRWPSKNDIFFMNTMVSADGGFGADPDFSLLFFSFSFSLPNRILS